MIQPLKLQGTIWQTVLKSQKVSVIWETPDTDLAESLAQLKEAGLTLPDLLLIDVNVKGFQPYAFCRWCAKNHPDVKVLLTNGNQGNISSPERQWAINQGAADLLPCFQRNQLVTSVTAGVKRVLEALGDHPLDNGALISLLLAMKRELEDRRSNIPSSLQLNGKTLKKQKDDASISSNSNQTSENGQAPSILRNSQSSATLTKKWRGEAQTNSKPDLSYENNDSTADEEPPPRRRYRGMTY